MKALITLLLLGAFQFAHASSGGSVSNDVVIVGAGISGLCAALEAGRAGAQVAVLDMASVFGGHAVMSSGMVCLIGTREQRASRVIDSPALARGDFLRHGEDGDPDWIRFYVRHSRRDIYDWLGGLGVTEWELFPQIIPGNTVRRQHVAKGRGIGLVSPIYVACLDCPNITFQWNTKVTSLLADSGRIVGVRAVQVRNGQTNEFGAAAVVLATGGFESNLEKVRAHWPRYFPQCNENTRVLLGSGVNAQGGGLQLAGQTGARLARLDHQLFYSTGLVDPHDPTGSRGTHAFNSAAIWVNAQGRRFVRDGLPDPKTQVPAVLQQTPPTHWQIFDSASRPLFFVSGSDWNDPRAIQRGIFDNPKLSPWVKQADSIEDLALSAGLPPDALVATVRRWNDLVASGVDTDFHRFDRGSLIRPVTIARPPFFAIQLFPLSRKSMGGVAVDRSCRVLENRSQPIPGLYAVGELAGVGGINGRAALEGTMLGPGILMGRTAASDILSKLKLGGKPASPGHPAHVAPPVWRPTASETLQSWREVLRQVIAQPRPGYWHFEKAHQRVLERDYDCAQCHSEASPLALTDQQLDRRALTRACALCHGGVAE